MKALGIAATGMNAQQKSLDVLANNIANLSTAGFKRQRVEFSDLLYQTETRMGTSGGTDGSIVPTGIQMGLGVKVGSVYRINEQGTLQETSDQFDMGINGQGYFQVTLPSGETGYTRAGQFQLNADGELVTSQGYTVLPGITVPSNATSVDINAEGEVLATLPDTVAQQNLGQIELAVFVNQSGLEALGNNLFAETEASGTAILNNPGTEGFGTILQGYFEGSNVDSVTEITTLITTQRAFELNSRVMTAADEVLQTIGNIR